MSALPRTPPVPPATAPTLCVRTWAPADDPRPLAGVAPGGAAAKLVHPVPLPFPVLGGTSRAEFWFGTTAATHHDEEGLRLATDGRLLFGAQAVDEAAAGSLEAAAEAGYRRLLAACAAHGYPHLLRVWNYFGAINAGVGDDERYRRFCVGRARAIPQEPPTGYAAATAIGIPGPPAALHLHWIAARRPGVAIENPRQVSAWEYPREYGPVAPGFSRAMLIEDPVSPTLLISGTASVLGHASAHGDTLAQLAETLVNLTAVIDRAGARIGRRAALGRDTPMRVYLRDPGDARAVTAYLLERFGPQAPFMLLHGDVCRRELRLEIEAVQHFPTD